MSFDEVDEQLTLNRYNDLCRFWKRCPPMAVLLAGYVGFKGESASAPPSANEDGDDILDLSEEDAMELARVFGLPIKQQ